MRVIEAEPPLCSLFYDELPATPRRAMTASDGCTQPPLPPRPNYFEQRERAEYTTPETSCYREWTSDSSTSATEHGGSAAMELGTTERYGSNRRHRLSVLREVATGRGAPTLTGLVKPNLLYCTRRHAAALHNNRVFSGSVSARVCAGWSTTVTWRKWKRGALTATPKSRSSPVARP